MIHSFDRLVPLLLALLASPCCAAAVPLYTAGHPPSTPALDELQLRETVTKDGVTWTFEVPARVGNFVNGDYYVIGPVTILAIDPPPVDGRNGSVLNLPPVANQTGFDSRTQANRYSASLRANLPIRMEPGDALASSISVETVGTMKRVFRTSDDTISPVRSVSVLTCVAAPLPPDAFRPSYCDRDQTVCLSRHLRRHLMLRLSPVPDTPTLTEFEGYLRRPWIDTLFFGFDAPIEYMPDYGREVARVTGIAGLLLQLHHSPEAKEPLLVFLVQYGIDLRGIARAGHPGWPAHGGHGSGRKWPVVFAGVMLGEPAFHETAALFGEDMQTIHGQGWTGATALYGGHVGEAGQDGWGAYEHLCPGEWESMIGEDYRRCCTSIAWVGAALAANLMQIESAWNHPPFFDYVDRWMTEDDTEHVDIIQAETGRSYHANWQRQGQAWDRFVNQMWAAYRFADRPLPPSRLRVEE